MPTFTVIWSGQLTAAFLAPCAASDFFTADSALEPGTCTEPGLMAYVNLLPPVWVTTTLPAAPLLNSTVQVNVAPFSALTSSVQLSVVTAVEDVDMLCFMPFSTWAESTVLEPPPPPQPAIRPMP